MPFELIYYLIFIKPWNKRNKRQVISEMEKFYFFDVGVGNYLCRKTNIVEKTPAFGDSFEHLILMELIAYKSYFGKKHRYPLLANQYRAGNRLHHW